LKEQTNMGKLFAQFHDFLDNLGMFVNQGKTVDASFVEVPRQRKTKEENAQIKASKGALKLLPKL
jgi:hypothetical protein